MRNELSAVLDFAVARSQEAEAFFKRWAPQEELPEIQAWFARLAAGEHGRAEMLSRMHPEELVSKTAVAPLLLDLLVRVREPAGLTREKAIHLAAQRKRITGCLYDRIAELGGEACSFFRAMADEDRCAVCELERYAKQLGTSKDDGAGGE